MIIDAKRKFKLTINKTHVDRACESGSRCDPNYCVVAEAAKDAFRALGRTVLAVQIGPTRTVIVMPGKEIRYQTSQELKKALVEFDETGKWSLPEGEYTLDPLPKSLTKSYDKARWKKRKAANDPNKNSHRPADEVSRMRKSPVFSARAISFDKERKDNSAKGISY